MRPRTKQKRNIPRIETQICNAVCSVSNPNNCRVLYLYSDQKVSVEFIHKIGDIKANKILDKVRKMIGDTMTTVGIRRSDGKRISVITIGYRSLKEMFIRLDEA